MENYDLIILNFANCDMVGHTAVWDAIVKAVEDVDTCVNHMVSRDLNRIYKFDEYMSYEFVPTNHLTGSCQIVMYIKKKSGNVVKIHYTGDLGSELGKHFGTYLRDTEIVTTSNLVISECTYFGNVEADYTKQDGIEERKDIKTQIWNTLHSNGKYRG